ncbi:uncharacterized protein [Euwallacea fornicatus]|uniref:uncharacterized protein n=1 Tax=Euwallacea fornicatus TaxID=995702 RepID=UPI00338F7D5C
MEVEAEVLEESFLKQLIATFKNNPVLWDKNHLKYKSRDARSVAMDELLTVTREYYPEANTDFVRTKLENMRNAFRREHRKVQESKNKSENGENLHIPKLWYYNLLLFLVGEEATEEVHIYVDNSRHSSWNRQNTVILIELLKKYPALHSLEPPSGGTKLIRLKAFEKLTTDLIAELGQKFEVKEVRTKVSMLKQQFKKAYKYRRHKVKFWCYNLLLFLRDSEGKSLKKVCKEEPHSADEDTKNMFFLKCDNGGMNVEPVEIDMCDDIFDIIGKNVALKLRDMSDDQRIHGERLVNEIMYNGLMEKLTAETTLNLS